jgi:ribosomal protein L16 Arg81 hydroxylase
MHILSPLSDEKFFGAYWGKGAMHIARDDATYLSRWISLSELDRLVTSIRIPLTNLNLAHGDSPLPVQEYASGDYIDKIKVLELHYGGATIILRAAEQWSPELNRLRIQVERDLGSSAQINVYFTPAGEKSTPPHWDTHDLLILQIEGSKRWRIFEGDRTDPLPDERFRIGEDQARFKGQEYLLRSGDTLYLPFGTIHEPIADTYSVHLSIGIQRPRVVDIAAEALRLASGREGGVLRRPIETIQASAFSFEELFSPESMMIAAEALATKVRREQSIDLQGRLIEMILARPEDPDTCYELRPDAQLQWTMDRETLKIIVNGDEMSVPRCLETSLIEIKKGKPFSSTILPGPASLEQKHAVCAALWHLSATRVAVLPGVDRSQNAEVSEVESCQQERISN